MKKINIVLTIILMMIIIAPTRVFAGSVSVSTGSISLSPGGGSSFTVTASGAAGRIDISSSNPGVASVSPSSIFLDNNSQTISVRAGSAGSAVITVRCTDVATYEEIPITNVYTIGVNVSAPAPTPTPTPTPNRPTNPSTNNSNNNTNNVNNNQQDNRSSNNNLKSFTVDNFKLETTDNTNYTLTVKNSITKINIKAVAADNKAKVSGAGEHSLKEGENKFEIIVEAENNSKKTYTLKVIRKTDIYDLKDINTAISESDDIVKILLKENEVISKENLEKMKKSNKTFRFIKNNDKKSLVYSWEIKGKDINTSNPIKTAINFSFDKKDVFDKITDYRDGIYLDFSHSGDVPKKTKITINIDNHYKDGDVLKLYYYDESNNTVKLITDNISVQNGLIEFEIDHCSKYFVTKATINNDIIEKSTSNNYLIIIVIGLLLIGGVYFLYKKGLIGKKKIVNNIDSDII